MKKFAVIISLVLVLMLGVMACAQTVNRVKGIDMEQPLCNMKVHVQIDKEFVHEDSIDAEIYDVMSYDIVDANTLAVGDTIETAHGDMEVKSVEEENGMIQVNGGFDHDGVTLVPRDEDNCYVSIADEADIKIMVGMAQLMYGETVTFNVYKMGEDLGIIGEGYDTVEVPKAEVQQKLNELLDKFYGTLSANSTTVELGEEDGVMTAITIDYMP